MVASSTFDSLACSCTSEMSAKALLEPHESMVLSVSVSFTKLAYIKDN